MASKEFAVESPENFEQKCLCTLVLDISSSMSGSPINELNTGLQGFQSDILKDSVSTAKLEVAVVTFGSSITVVQAPALVTSFTMPILCASGSTRLVDGVRVGIEKVQERKQWYRETHQPYYRPWIILITDGEPDPDQDITGLAQEIRSGVNNKAFVFLALGVQGANMAALNQISTPGMPALKLQGLKFLEFFRWLSNSMSAIGKSKSGEKVSFENPNAWMEGYIL